MESPLTRFFQPIKFRGVIELILLNITYPLASSLIPNSLYTLETLNKYYFFGKNYSTQIGNPVFLEEKSSIIKNKRRSLKIENDLVILNVARLWEVKDHKTLIKSFF